MFGHRDYLPCPCKGGNSVPYLYLLVLVAEKAMAPHSSTLAWKIPWTEEPGRLHPWGCWGSDTTEQLHFHFSLSCIREGNSNSLQCSCLENPRDGRAWWAAIYGVAQSQTQLKWLSSSIYIHTHTFFFIFFSIMVYHWIFSSSTILTVFWSSYSCCVTS